MAEALVIVVSGPSASGKSTLAPVLARELALPLVAKDTINAALPKVPESATQIAKPLD